MPINFSSSERKAPAQKGKGERLAEPHKKKTSKPTWLYLMDKNDLEAQFKCKKIK